MANNYTKNIQLQIPIEHVKAKTEEALMKAGF